MEKKFYEWEDLSFILDRYADKVYSPMPDQAHPRYAGLDRCWEWLGQLSHDGKYGTIPVLGKCIYAHRAAYTNAHGSIAPGLHVRHKCDNPRCVNPSHLILGTHADNMRDRCEKMRWAKKESKTKSRSEYMRDYMRKYRKGQKKVKKSQLVMSNTDPKEAS